RPISPEDPVDVKDVNTADIKAKLEMVQSELALVKAELQEIKANQLSGDQKVQLSGTIVAETILSNPVPLAAGETYFLPEIAQFSSPYKNVAALVRVSSNPDKFSVLLRFRTNFSGTP